MCKHANDHNCFLLQTRTMQIAEVDKLNAIINTAEKEMLRLRKQYEVCQ